MRELQEDPDNAELYAEWKRAIKEIQNLGTLVFRRRVHLGDEEISHLFDFEGQQILVKIVKFSLND